MSLQARTLHRYKQFFPRDNLREVSERTGIQITRVYRLFNGKAMKVKELEAMESVIMQKLRENPCQARLTEVLEDASALLTTEELSRIISWVERKNLAKTYGRMYVSPSLEQAYIA